MFILKSKHDAAIAAKDAEIAGLMKRLSKANADLIAEEMVADDRLNQIRKLHSQLARYTAPRERGEGGRFLPLKRVS